jgi:hypothetical protein
MAIVSHHHYPDQFTVDFDAQDSRRRSLDRSAKIFDRIIPRPSQSGIGPEGRHGPNVITA